MKKRRRAPGGGRKHAYGEPTIPLAVRLPESIVELLDKIGPNRNAALIAIVRDSIQYRLQFSSAADSAAAAVQSSR